MNDATFSELQDSLARQREWGTDNFKGTFYHGKQIMSPAEVEATNSAEEYNQITEQKITEMLGEGITRQEGNS